MKGGPENHIALMEDNTFPIRILFVLACLNDSYAEDELRVLTQHLSPSEYRFDVIVCFEEAGNLCGGNIPLQVLGIDVDCVPYNLSFEQTVIYLRQKLTAYDVIVSCQHVADIYPALERLQWRPPLIEFVEFSTEKRSEPKHFTSRFVVKYQTCDTRRANKLDSGAQTTETSFACEVEIVGAWRSVFDEVLTERCQAAEPSAFSSFIQGGFECSTHKRADGRRLDLIAATEHDTHVFGDYHQLRLHGITTVRDGLRWHLIEPHPGRFNWTTLLLMLNAAQSTRTEVIWDLMHYGWPDGLDIWSPGFVNRFADYAGEVARVVRSETDAIPFYCPINEISFLAWGGGEVACLNPFGTERSFELKVQLARAAIAAMHEILSVDPRARFVHCEPVINIVARSTDIGDRLKAEQARQAQFQAFDMISGSLWPQLGGQPHLLDITGVNYYPQNQWVLGGGAIRQSDDQYRPFRALLTEVYARYGRPILVSETGTEGDERADWFNMIAGEITAARKVGVPVEGLCLYPIIDHLGWDDDRSCPSGLMGNSFENGKRVEFRPLVDSIANFVEKRLR